MARGRRDYEKAVVAVESEGYRDLHGRILMNDTFEDTPFKWTSDGTGHHFETRQQRAAYNGSVGAELEVTSDFPPTFRTSEMWRYAPIDVTRRLELEMFWRVNDTDNLSVMQTRIQFWDGTAFHVAGVEYNQDIQQWRYTNNAGATVDLPGAEQTIYGGGWNELTLSADFATDRYIRAKSNNMEINMGEIPAWNFGNLAGAHVAVFIVAGTVAGDPLILSIDDVVLKELER